MSPGLANEKDGGGVCGGGSAKTRRLWEQLEVR